MTLAKISDHVAQAKARLLEQYKRTVTVNGLVAAAVNRVQEVEDGLWAVLTQRSIDAAVGEQLDKLGVLVGEPRNEKDDTTYRLWLRARLLINRGSGAGPELLAIFDLIKPVGATLQLVFEGPAAFALRILAVATSAPTPLAQVLGKARAAAVLGILEFLTTTAALSFTLDGSGAQALDNGLFAGALAS